MNEARTAKFSVPSIIAIIAALLSFTTGAFWGFVLAVIAMIAAIIGMVVAVSPNVRGGLMSTVSLVAGGIAFIAAIIKTIMWLL
jgi:hypothetical protein